MILTIIGWGFIILANVSYEFGVWLIRVSGRKTKRK